MQAPWGRPGAARPLWLCSGQMIIGNVRPRMNSASCFLSSRCPMSLAVPFTILLTIPLHLIPLNRGSLHMAETSYSR